jgi:hypothetical protein
VTNLIQGADIPFSKWEVVEPREVIEGVDKVIKSIDTHGRPDIVLLVLMIPHPWLLVMKSNRILIDEMHFSFIMLRVGMMCCIVRS